MGPDAVQVLPDVVRYILGAFSALGIGVFAVLWFKLRPPRPYSERLSEHMGVLLEASRKVDALIKELNNVAETREAAVRRLEHDLKHLHRREEELRRTIADLKDVPVPVADRFAALLAPSERRSAVRDYALFGAGVMVSTIVGIVLEIAL